MSSSKPCMGLLGFFSAERSNRPCTIFSDAKEDNSKEQILEEIFIIERISCLLYCCSVHLFG